MIFGYSSDAVRQMGSIATLLGRELIVPEDVRKQGEIQNIEHEIQTKERTARALLVE